MNEPKKRGRPVGSKTAPEKLKGNPARSIRCNDEEYRYLMAQLAEYRASRKS